MLTLDLQKKVLKYIKRNFVMRRITFESLSKNQMIGKIVCSQNLLIRTIWVLNWWSGDPINEEIRGGKENQI